MSERSSHWQLQTIVSQLRGARDQWRSRNGRLSGEHGGRELPSRQAVAQILESLCGALFPMRLGPADHRVGPAIAGRNQSRVETDHRTDHP